MTTTRTSRIQQASTFLVNLHTRIRNDNGAKADLKRALSGEPRHLRAIYPLVLPYLYGVQEREQEQIWVPIACLSVYYPQNALDKQRDFGSSCQALKKATSSDGVERRFRALLDTALVDVLSPTTALVRQMKSKEVLINYPQLILDLCRWNHPDQYIQDQWARSFWAAPANLPETADLTEQPLPLGETTDET